jgi:hypothetical protein
MCILGVLILTLFLADIEQKNKKNNKKSDKNKRFFTGSVLNYLK